MPIGNWSLKFICDLGFDLWLLRFLQTATFLLEIFEQPLVKVKKILRICNNYHEKNILTIKKKNRHCESYIHKGGIKAETEERNCTEFVVKPPKAYGNGQKVRKNAR